MNWLIGLVAITQVFFYWLLKPVIAISTPLFEIRVLGLLILAFLLWAFSGSNK